MPGSGYSSFGSGLALGTGSPPAVIKGMKEATPEGIAVTQIKEGALDDATRFYNYACGRGTPPKIKYKYEYRGSHPNTNWDAFNALLFIDGLNYIHTFGDGSTCYGTAQISDLGLPESPEDDEHTFSLEIQCNTVLRT